MIQLPSELRPLLPANTPRGNLERRIRVAISVAQMSQEAAFTVAMLALRCYESDSVTGEAKS